MSRKLLEVAVVGHTNTGKTSLLRTLMRDVTFGEVSDRPAVTRAVEKAVLSAGGVPVIELFDTPGLEDSIGLLERLESLRTAAAGAGRGDGAATVEAFLASDDAHGRFAQEAKALRQVVASDVALYVIDARDRVLAKHRDELEILARCARPVVPVLNFVASGHARTAEWREHLARVNMHAIAEFDTVVYDVDGERRLYEKMASLADVHRATLEALVADRREQRRTLVRSSALLVAELVVDAAAERLVVETGERERTEATLERLRDRVRAREQSCVERLLALHRFRADDVADDGTVPLEDGAWGLDLFSATAMKQFGVRTGSGAAAGAMVGLTLDAMFGGLSLGAATAAGAAIGGLLGAARTHGRKLVDLVRGRTAVRCDDATIELLAARQVALVRALLRRGHASMDAIDVTASPTEGLAKDVRRAVRDQADVARMLARPSGASAGPEGTGDPEPFGRVAARREEAVRTLAAALESAIDA